MVMSLICTNNLKFIYVLTYLFIFIRGTKKEPDICLVLRLAYSLNCATRFESSVARFSVSPIFA